MLWDLRFVIGLVFISNRSVKEKMIFIFILLFTLQSFGKEFPSLSSHENVVHITTLNLNWYGNTKFHPMKDEVRDPIIKEFITTDLSSTDLFLFQEITKPEQFEQLLESHFKCLAYDDRGRAHQYVVTCFDSTKFELLDSSDELFNPDRTLFITEKKERLRDVLVTSFRDKKSGHIFHTFNLHLKAGPKETEKRERQISSLLQQLDEQNIPVDHTIIIGGDFNSYDLTLENDQQINEMDNFLKKGLKRGFEFFTRQDRPTTLAYIQKTFDYLLIKSPQSVQNYKVHPICKKPNLSNPKRAFDDFNFFKKAISDHCPVTSQITM